MRHTEERKTEVKGLHPIGRFREMEESRMTPRPGGWKMQCQSLKQGLQGKKAIGTKALVPS